MDLSHHSSFKRLSSICFFVLIFAYQILNVFCASDGDIDDWNDYRTFYAGCVFVMIFVIGPDNPFWNEENPSGGDPTPIITVWILCMFILGLWATSGIVQ